MASTSAATFLEMSEIDSENDSLVYDVPTATACASGSLSITGAPIWSTETPIYCLFCDWYYSEAEHQCHFEQCTQSGGQHWKAHRAATALNSADGGDDSGDDAENKTAVDDHQVALVISKEGDEELGGKLALQSAAVQNSGLNQQLLALGSRIRTFKLTTLFWMAVATALVIFYNITFFADMIHFSLF